MILFTFLYTRTCLNGAAGICCFDSLEMTHAFQIVLKHATALQKSMINFTKKFFRALIIAAPSTSSLVRLNHLWKFRFSFLVDVTCFSAFGYNLAMQQPQCFDKSPWKHYFSVLVSKRLSLKAFIQLESTGSYRSQLAVQFKFLSRQNFQLCITQFALQLCLNFVIIESRSHCFYILYLKLHYDNIGNMITFSILS